MIRGAVEGNRNLLDISSLIERWTTPHPSVVDEQARSRAQLFALLSLLGVISTAIVLVVLALIGFPLHLTDMLILPLALAFYLASRSRWYSAGIVACMLANYLWAVTTILESDNREYTTFILIMPVIFVSLMFSARVTMIAVVSSILLALITTTQDGGISKVVIFAAIFILISAIGIVIAALLRERDQRILIARAAQLETSEARYRALFRNSPIPLSEEDFSALYSVTDALRNQGVEDIERYLLDHPEVVEQVFRKLQVLEINPATLSLYHAVTPDEFGSYYSDEFFRRNQESLARSLIALWKGDPSFEYEAIDQDMSGRLFESRIHWVRTSDHPPRYVVSVEDLSPIKEAERQRQELAVERARVEMLQRFLGDATHDLLTPITIIHTSVHLALRTQDVEAVHERMRTIQLQAQHLQTMISDMLTMSRLDNPTETAFSFEIGDLTPHLEQLVREFDSLAQSKQQTIAFRADCPYHKVRYDKRMLDRAFRNLIQNAIKYTQSGGSITICVSQADEHLVIKVSDTGAGIAPDDLPHIFERFYRAEAHRPIDGGAGLGLAIVRKIIQAHQGKIDVHSTPGIGTTFTIRLPIAQEAAA
jgi:signal transduction histidine kinase